MKQSPLIKKHLCPHENGLRSDYCPCFREAEAAVRKDIERKLRRYWNKTYGKDILENGIEELLAIINPPKP